VFCFCLQEARELMEELDGMNTEMAQLESGSRCAQTTPLHTGRRFHSESTLQEIEIGQILQDLDV